MSEYGGNPVKEFWQGRRSLRELRVMVSNLPPGSAIHRSDPESRGWQVSDYLLADLYDAMNTLVGLTGAKYMGAEQFQPPKPRQRPGDEDEKTQIRRSSAKVIRRVREIESIALGRK